MQLGLAIVLTLCVTEIVILMIPDQAHKIVLTIGIAKILNLGLNDISLGENVEVI